MVSDTDRRGEYQANPFHFQNFGATYLCIRANMEQIQRLAYQPNLTIRDYIRSYVGVLEALGFDIGQNFREPSPEEGENGCNIYAFKITPDPNTTLRFPPRLGSAPL